MNIKILTVACLTIALLSGCSDKEKTKSLTEVSMKCGAGKCGGSMANGSALLVKKKMNILDQMTKEDTRRDCVLKSKTTKKLYACVRVSETGQLSTKCAADNVKPKEVPKKKYHLYQNVKVENVVVICKKSKEKKSRVIQKPKGF